MPVTMYRHSPSQVRAWLGASGLIQLRDLVFSAFMDRERTRCLPVHAYLASKGVRPL
ncbi:MAG TPA: hypothetical protein VJ787_02935 [Thermoleophilia bacterium]|nr:hypothetical protein [Thermoleophilia bacterium]